MNTIHLQQVLPQVFADRDNLTSDVWHQDIIFEKGKYYLIEAASGTGKSSLCSYLYGYRDDYQGIICFDGQNTRSLRRPAWTRLRRHSLSLLFQELRLFPELTALENVLLKNRLTGYKKKKELLALFEALGIADKTHELLGKLSLLSSKRLALPTKPMNFSVNCPSASNNGWLLSVAYASLWISLCWTSLSAIWMRPTRSSWRNCLPKKPDDKERASSLLLSENILK